MVSVLNRIDKILLQLNNILDTNNNDNKSFEDENEVSMIDHIVYFVKDLEAAIDKFSKLLGVKPIIGGRHLKWGSWNALFSLDNGTYFELLADDPNSSIEHTGFLKQLVSNTSNGEGIVTYMFRPPQKYTKNLKQFKSLVKQNINYNGGSIFGGERALNNGKILKWDLMCPLKDNEQYKIYQDAKGVIGICIDWQLNDPNIHPSYTTPKGCKLLQLKCFHPDYENISKILSTLNIETQRFKFEYDSNVRFTVKLSTPNGIVDI
eukprot:450227_1